MIFQSSMTFPENFIFPGFPDPVGTLIYHPWELCGIHLRAISQEVLVSLMHKTYSKITLLTL